MMIDCERSEEFIIEDHLRDNMRGVSAGAAPQRKQGGV